MKKYAGKTTVWCGTTIRITKIAEGNPDDEHLVGLTGRIADVFSDLIYYQDEIHKAGVYLDNSSTYSNDRCNLLQGDEFEVVDESTAKEYPEGL